MDKIDYLVMFSFLMIMPFFAKYVEVSCKKSGYKYIKVHVLNLLFLVFAEKYLLFLKFELFTSSYERTVFVLYLLFLNLFFTERFKIFTDSSFVELKD